MKDEEKYKTAVELWRKVGIMANELDQENQYVFLQMSFVTALQLMRIMCEPDELNDFIGAALADTEMPKELINIYKSVEKH